MYVRVRTALHTDYMCVHVRAHATKALAHACRCIRAPSPSPRTGLRDAIPRFSLPSLASVPLPLPLVTLFSTSRRVRSLEIHFCARQCERGSCAAVLHGLRGSGDQYPDSVKKASWCQYPLVPLRSSAHDCYLKVMIGTKPTK